MWLWCVCPGRPEEDAKHPPALFHWDRTLLKPKFIFPLFALGWLDSELLVYLPPSPPSAGLLGMCAQAWLEFELRSSGLHCQCPLLAIGCPRLISFVWYNTRTRQFIRRWLHLGLRLQRDKSLSLSQWGSVAANRCGFWRWKLRAHSTSMKQRANWECCMVVASKLNPTDVHCPTRSHP